MRKTFTLLFILVFFLASAGLVFSGQNQEDEKFQKALENYFDALWKFYPTLATMAGYHKYDNKLEDLGKKNIEKRHTGLDELNQEFVAKVDKMALSPDRQIDHEMIVDALDLEIVRHEMLVPWNYNPLFYNQILANCVRCLMTGDFGTPDERAKNAIERLKDLPKFCKQATENLETPPQIYTETAIKQFPGILNFYKNEMPQLIAQAPAAHQAKLQENLTKAIADLETYQNFLTNTLLPKSTGSFRLASAHSRLLRATMQSDIPIQDLVARATADEKNLRREMTFICSAFYKIMDPQFDINNPPPNLNAEQLINVISSHVLERIESAHISKDEFIEQLKTIKEDIKNFIQEKELVDIPSNNLTINPMPVEVQGLTWTHLVRPSPYSASEDFTLEVASLPDDLSEDQTEAILKEYNNYLLPFYVTRKIYPGQFVPFYFALKNSSQVQKFYPNMPLIKGWPLFIEDMLVKSGFGNYDLRLYICQLKYRLKAVIDFKLELNIHSGGMAKDQAIAYMTRNGFMTEAEAERNWIRIILNPGDAIYTYAGLQEFLDMEEAYKQKMGNSYSQKEFLGKLLSYGCLPIRHLKRKMQE